MNEREYRNGMLFLAISAALLLVYAYWPQEREQKPWECRPYPGYCDTDTDNAKWRK